MLQQSRCTCTVRVSCYRCLLEETGANSPSRFVAVTLPLVTVCSHSHSSAPAAGSGKGAGMCVPDCARHAGHGQVGVL